LIEVGYSQLPAERQRRNASAIIGIKDMSLKILEAFSYFKEMKASVRRAV
jgi:hypothetical protein